MKVVNCKCKLIEAQKELNRRVNMEQDKRRRVAAEPPALTDDSPLMRIVAERLWRRIYGEPVFPTPGQKMIMFPPSKRGYLIRRIPVRVKLRIPDWTRSLRNRQKLIEAIIHKALKTTRGSDYS